MKRHLIKEIAAKGNVSEAGLRVTLSRIKRRHDLKSIEQAACFYVKKRKLSINVSSLIDDVTREAVRNALGPPSAPKPPSKAASKSRQKPKAPLVKWIPKRHYSIADKLSDFYPYLFIFENALRRAISSRMKSAFNDNWWEDKIKKELYEVWRYADDEKKRQAKLPIVGKTLKLDELELLTVGHLEQIVQKYHKLFFTSLFPSLHFFTGHMIIIKQVRNATAHVSPAVTSKDIKNARNEIDILLQHMASL